ncbi:HutD/Ves family protein [Sphingomonas sp. VNH70]|uniref:HutD/Ves family protein n=1 Tax=Sphingomonas silueang TaxID=3156617 RepID=UPI0032B56AAB
MERSGDRRDAPRRCGLCRRRRLRARTGPRPAGHHRLSAAPLRRAADRVATPWRNGAGVTAQVAAGDGWRVSIATLDRDAPFSRFDGHDRTLVLLDGAITLVGIGWSQALAAGDSIAFPGDEAITATVAVPAHALNVMSRHDRWTHAVRRVAAPRVLEPGEIALVLGGDVRVDGERAARLDAVIGPARIAGSGQLLAIRFAAQKR